MKQRFSRWRGNYGTTDALSPSCTESTGTVASRDVLDTGGLAATFECDQCEERWDVVF